MHSSLRFHGSRHRGVIAAAALMRPEPAESTGGKRSVDQPVEGGFERQAPGAPVPDRELTERERVPHERGCADDLKYPQVGCSGGERSPGNVCREDPDFVPYRREQLPEKEN